MNRYIPASLFLAMAVCQATAQPSKGAQGAGDPEAKKILDAVSARFKAYKAVKAAFTLRIANAAGKEQGSKSGTVQMKGVKYRISLDGQEIFCDGKTVWTYDKGANEVQLTNLDKSGGSITPQKLFTNFYDRDFLYKLNEERKVGGKTIQYIELTPIDKSKPFFKVIVEVDKAARNIMATTVFEKSGNRFAYSVGAMKTSADIPDASFLFDPKKYPGVEVIDLR